MEWTLSEPHEQKIVKRYFPMENCNSVIRTKVTKSWQVRNEWPLLISVLYSWIKFSHELFFILIRVCIKMWYYLMSTLIMTGWSFTVIIQTPYPPSLSSLTAHSSYFLHLALVQRWNYRKWVQYGGVPWKTSLFFCRITFRENSWKFTFSPVYFRKYIEKNFKHVGIKNI